MFSRMVFHRGLFLAESYYEWFARSSFGCDLTLWLLQGDACQGSQAAVLVRAQRWAHAADPLHHRHTEERVPRAYHRGDDLTSKLCCAARFATAGA